MSKPSTHQELLLRLTAPGGDLSTTGSFTSTRHPDWYDSGEMHERRAEVHARLMTSFMDSTVGRLDRRAIVTSGPPGAGKTSAVHSLVSDLGLKASDFRSIDPDSFKDLLLRQAARDGSLDALISGDVRLLQQAGGVFHLREFGGLVHQESCALAFNAVALSQGRDENLIHDGTMSTRAGASRVIKPLQRAGYQVTIVHVECSLEQAIGRTRDRWRAGRQAALAEPPGSTSDRALGARFVPPDYIASLYPPDRPDRSHSSDIARWAFHHYPAVTELHSYRVPPGQNAPVLERILLKTPEGRIIDTKPSGDELPAHVKELRRAIGPQRLSAQRPTPTGTTPARPPATTRRRPNQLER